MDDHSLERCSLASPLAAIAVALLLTGPMAPTAAGAARSLSSRGPATETAAACPGDADCDGIPDTEDVCPTTADPLQEDGDGDLVGDACDACPGDPLNDEDGDGICFYNDNCPSFANPGEEDRDGDREGDACDYNDGDVMIGWSAQNTLTWQRDVPYDLFHLYRRNVADLRATGVYVLDPQTAGPLDARSCGIPSDVATDETPAPGEAVVYFMTAATGQSEQALGVDSGGDHRVNAHACGCNRSFERVLNAQDGPHLAQDLVIDNLADWCTFRPAECGSNLIDFDTHVALVHAAGTKVNGCYRTFISCVQDGPTETEVKVSDLLSEPGAGCSCTFAEVYPIDVVKILRPVATATFQGSTIVNTCH